MVGTENTAHLQYSTGLWWKRFVETCEWVQLVQLLFHPDKIAYEPFIVCVFVKNLMDLERF